MIHKRIESDIRSVQGFLEFWVKFHALYEKTISRGLITAEDEKKFLDTRQVISEKYETLKGSLDFNYTPHMRLTDPVSGVLGVHSISHISENNLKKIQDDWKDSYVFLNSVLERLKNNRNRLEKFNPIGVFLKRFFERG